MEHNLYAIVVVIEELHPADLVENRVGVIVSHIVRGDWRESVPFESQDTTLQKDVVFFGQKFVRTWQCTVFSVETKDKSSSDGSEGPRTRWNGWRGRKAWHRFCSGSLSLCLGAVL